MAARLSLRRPLWGRFARPLVAVLQSDFDIRGLLISELSGGLHRHAIGVGLYGQSQAAVEPARQQAHAAEVSAVKKLGMIDQWRLRGNLRSLLDREEDCAKCPLAVWIDGAVTNQVAGQRARGKLAARRESLERLVRSREKDNLEVFLPRSRSFCRWFAFRGAQSATINSQSNIKVPKTYHYTYHVRFICIP